MIRVVIPYRGNKGGADLLRYAVRSWETHFKEDFAPVILSGEKPPWLLDEFFIRVGDFPHVHKEANLGRKLRYAAGLFPEFVWTNDDIILTGDLCLAEIKKPRYIQDDYSRLKKSRPQAAMDKRLIRLHQKWMETGVIPDPIPGAPNWVWQLLLAGTVRGLQDLNYTAYNGETHCPFFVDSGKLSRLSRVFKIWEGLHLMQTAYLNCFSDFPLFQTKGYRQFVHEPDGCHAALNGGTKMAAFLTPAKSASAVSCLEKRFSGNGVFEN